MTFKHIYFLIKNLTYLTKSRVPNKSYIIFKYISISTKYFLSNLFNLGLKKEKIFNYTIEAFDYSTIQFLFGEIFVRLEYAFYSDKIQPTIFDCGGNVGMATIFFKWLYPKSIIHVFEPDPQTFALLKKNIENNKLEDVFMYNSAITDTDGITDFFIDENVKGSLIMSVNKNRMDRSKITVKTISLNKFIQNNNLREIDFAKVDIEGSEFKLLRDLVSGGSIKNIKLFAMEYHHKIKDAKSELGDFLNLLEKSNFEYQIDTQMIPLESTKRFQDIIIRAYK